MSTESILGRLGFFTGRGRAHVLQHVLAVDHLTTRPGILERTEPCSHRTDHRWSIVPSDFAKGGSNISSIHFRLFSPLPMSQYSYRLLLAIPCLNLPSVFPAQSCTLPYVHIPFT
ncbi:unnamed protein product [Ectocarpus sp. 6 AP-2014]